MSSTSSVPSVRPPLPPASINANGLNNTPSPSASKSQPSACSAQAFINGLTLPLLPKEKVNEKIKEVRELTKLMAEPAPSYNLQNCRLNALIELLNHCYKETQNTLNSLKDDHLKVVQSCYKMGAERQAANKKLETLNKQIEQLQSELKTSKECAQMQTMRTEQLQKQLDQQKIQVGQTSTLTAQVNDLTRQLEESKKLLTESQNSTTKILDTARQAQALLTSALTNQQPSIQASTSSTSSLPSTTYFPESTTQQKKRAAESANMSTRPKRKVSQAKNIPK